MKKSLLVLAALLVVSGGLVSLTAGGQDTAAQQRGASTPSAPEVVTPVPIRYDTGTPAAHFRQGGFNPQVIGNRFDTNSGSPLAGGTVTGGSVYARSPYYGSPTFPARVTFISPNPTTGNYPVYPVIARANFQSPITASTLVPKFFTTGTFINVPGSFLAGLYVGYAGGKERGAGEGTYNGYYSGLSIGMGTASRIVVTTGSNTIPLGFHAFEMAWVGYNAASGYSAIAGENAMLRLSGDLLVPVELMEFEVE